MSVALLPRSTSNTSHSDSNSFCDNNEDLVNQMNHQEEDNQSLDTISVLSKSAKLKQQTVLQLFEKSASYDDGGERHVAITQSLVFMIIKDNLPLSCVEKEGLKQFVHVACPRYKLPSRFKVTDLIEQRYSTTKAILINHLQETRYLTMSSDIVTITNSTRSFLIITVHFLNVADESLNSCCLTAHYMTEGHTGEYIKDCFENITSDFSIDKSKIVNFSTDNGSNMVAAVNLFLGTKKRIPCVAHTINLIIDGVLKNNTNFSNLADQIKRIVTYFKHSVSASDELRSEQLAEGKKEGQILMLIQAQYKMKCHVPGANVKVLARTVHALARFGDELYLESLPDCILLRTLNAAESAYAMVKFNKNFFSYFNYNFYSTEDNEGLKCKISMKSALNTFKSPAHIDKQVENLEIKLDPESCKLIFQLKCRHGIVKTHFVSILDCKAMQAVYTKDSVPNRITSPQRILSDALSNFQSSDDQVTLEATSNSLILRNYIDCSIDLTKIIRTQISLKPAEFDSYLIGTDTTITFSLKEFRALLTFSEALNLPLQLHFETTGRPAVFIVHNGTTFEAHFVLATTKPDNASQTTATQNTNVERNKRKDTSTQGSAKKRPHLETDISKCLDEDSHLFNFVDIPGENEINLSNKLNGSINKDNANSKEKVELMDCDNIPASPAARTMIKSVFKRCFENTFDPRSIQGVVLAENSDSE
ncbi:hypothetical protein PYW08_008331 [Mythimna loreyi]|uniref:Uncharacterized protein n=1 Tax=Mythimna loreyi TaxID=667449 RepID=A0ACC2QBJ9_9NEOP|nr:hypothetical protein PYW08_008331 [Mythimna loreyi]